MNKLPNIILVMMDATRHDHLSCYGYHRNTSPFIDSIAGKSVLYKQAVSAAPWTLPSVASLFTGMFPSKHGTDGPNPYLSGGYATLAEILKASGYETMAIADGSWISSLTNFDRGFDSFLKLWQYFQDSSNIAAYRMVKAFSEDGFGLSHFIDVLRKGNFFKNIINGFYGKYLYKHYDYGAKRINQLFSDWLKQNYDKEKPLFAFLHYMESHLEYKPPKPFDKLFLENTEEAASKVNQNALDYICQKIQMSENDFEILRALYDAEIKYMDFRIEEMYANLAKFIDMDNTLFILMADHGENIGEHGLMDHQYCIYDTLIRVPLIIKFPKGEFDALSVENQVQSVDIFYSILERIGKEPKSFNQLDGCSLLPSATREDRLAFAEYLHPQPKMEIINKRYPHFDSKKINRGLRAVRTLNHKYILSSSGEEELYHIVNDPEETVNIAQENYHVCKELRETLTGKMGEFKTSESRKKEINEAMRRRLESLGYIS